MSVLIVTKARDEHAHAVAATTRALGGQCDIWMTSDFPSSQMHTVSFGSERTNICIDGDKKALRDRSAIWVRRPSHPQTPQYRVHPDDEAFVAMALRTYHRSLWQMISRSNTSAVSRRARWINHPAQIDAAESKLLQIDYAKEVGFAVPNTIVSNDKVEICRFINANPAGTIRKSLSPFIWVEGEQTTSNVTSLITIDMLPSNATIQLYPEIYQEFIQKNQRLEHFLLEQTVIVLHFFQKNRSGHVSIGECFTFMAVPSVSRSNCQMT